MIWRPKHLTHSQCAERRLEAGRLLQAGSLAQADVGRRLGVSRMAVSLWAKHLRQHHGDTAGSRTRPLPGPLGRLRAEPWPRVPVVRTEGALKAGGDTERWSLCRLRAFIKPVEGPHVR
jgi:hypothetical protein